MKTGIVGSEGLKFTSETEEKARALIRYLIRNSTEVVSGKCHLGGIDIWAVEEADKLGIATKEFAPKRKTWEFYKERNLQIAQWSDVTYCITVKELPPSFTGMKFDYCYHCKTNEHVKSGGCWTVLQAKKMGKISSRVFVI